MIIESFAVKIPQKMSYEESSLILNNITPKQRIKIEKYRLGNDKYRGLVSQALIRVILCQMLKCNNSDLVFGYNTFGKPYVYSNIQLEYNISHSGKWVVGSFGRKPVGIDIELIKEELDYEMYTKDFFSSNEHLYINNLKKAEIPNYFFELWTLKESYIKCIGMGLSIPLHSFSILKNTESISVIDLKGHILPYNFTQYNIDQDYKLAVCSTSSIFAKQIKLIEYQNVMRLFKQICNAKGSFI
ncbi:4'-phosphopantetheinyl transferase family protein [Bacillus sp. R86525]|uniref:4'-phosphopantetheinyl transferase family protein n=1 Tax=Bacillus sp. R86525 TaxID=3101709 RepID=UPI003672AF2B